MNLRGTFHHHRLTVERLAVQRRGRRTSGSSMLLRFHCGGIVRCNGLFDGTFPRDCRPTPHNPSHILDLPPRPTVKLLKRQDFETLVIPSERTIIDRGGSAHEVAADLASHAAPTWLRNRSGRITLLQLSKCSAPFRRCPFCDGNVCASLRSSRWGDRALRTNLVRRAMNSSRAPRMLLQVNDQVGRPCENPYHLAYS